MGMTWEVMHPYEVLQEAAYGGRTLEWFRGETSQPNERRKEATAFLLAQGWLETTAPTVHAVSYYRAWT
jgi:hypothetical protein